VTGRLWTRTNGSQQSETLVVDGSTEQLSLSISDNLWLHLHKNLLTRAAPPLQSFLAQKIEVMNHIGPDKDIEYLSGSYQVCGLDILGNDDKTSGPTNNDTTRYTVLAEHLEGFKGLSDNRGSLCLENDGSTEFGDDLLFNATPAPDINMLDKESWSRSDSLYAKTCPQSHHETCMLSNDGVKSRRPCSFSFSERTEIFTSSPGVCASAEFLEAKQPYNEDLLCNGYRKKHEENVENCNSGCND
jgi:hypothetical protein